MENRFRFSMSNLLLAATLAAVWCALIVNRKGIGAWVQQTAISAGFEIVGFERLARGVYIAILVSLPAVILGVLARRPFLGALCGLASAAVAVWINRVMGSL